MARTRRMKEAGQPYREGQAATRTHMKWTCSPSKASLADRPVTPTPATALASCAPVSTPGSGHPFSYLPDREESAGAGRLNSASIAQ